MKTKTIIGIVLLGFVAISLGWLFVQQSPDELAKAESNITSAEGIGPSTPDPIPDSTLASAPPTSCSDSAGSAAPCRVSALPDRVIVYYFHNTYRCSTCYDIENYTKKAVETGFAKELRDGRLEFQVIDIDEPASSHFVQDYQLTTKSVVLVDIRRSKQARWGNLPKIWDLVEDKPKFIKYIQDEVNLYLQGK